MREGEQKGNKRDIIAIGASAGGLQALTAVLSVLPRDLAATVIVVQHLDPRYESHIPDILSRRCALPDRHMLVEQDRIRLTTTELVHFVRPSVDLLFESAAAAYGPRVIGVILTGSGSDGALGIRDRQSPGLGRRGSAGNSRKWCAGEIGPRDRCFVSSSGGAAQAKPLEPAER